jgi:hypothetical protein
VHLAQLGYTCNILATTTTIRGILNELLNFCLLYNHLVYLSISSNIVCRGTSIDRLLCCGLTRLCVTALQRIYFIKNPCCLWIWTRFRNSPNPNPTVTILFQILNLCPRGPYTVLLIFQIVFFRFIGYGSHGWLC